MKLRVGDSVIVLVGKDRGKTGKIVRLFPRKGLVSVEGINKKVKHIKGQEGRVGERVEIFAPLAISNVAIVDPKTKKPTRVGYRIENGEKVRIAKKSGTPIQITKKVKSNTIKA